MSESIEQLFSEWREKTQLVSERDSEADAAEARQKLFAADVVRAQQTLSQATLEAKQADSAATALRTEADRVREEARDVDAKLRQALDLVINELDLE
ncbi:MAG: hypothetical protein AAFU85_33745 [Planctomycetota bacterium]